MFVLFANTPPEELALMLIAIAIFLTVGLKLLEDWTTVRKTRKRKSRYYD